MSRKKNNIVLFLKITAIILILFSISCTSNESNKQEIETKTINFTLNKTNEIQSYYENYNTSYNEIITSFESEFSLSRNIERERRILHLLMMRHSGEDNQIATEIAEYIVTNDYQPSVSILINRYNETNFDNGNMKQTHIVDALSFIGGDQAYSFLNDIVSSADEHPVPTMDCGQLDPAFSEVEIKVQIITDMTLCYKIYQSENCKNALLNLLSNNNVADKLKGFVVASLKDAEVSMTEIEAHAPDLSEEYLELKLIYASDIELPENENDPDKEICDISECGEYPEGP